MAALPPQVAVVAAASGDRRFTISAKTALDVTGMSWVWCLRFARKHNVEILRPAPRKQLIVFADLVAAMRRVSAEQHVEPELTAEQVADRILADLGYVPVRGGAQ